MLGVTLLNVISDIGEWIKCKRYSDGYDGYVKKSNLKNLRTKINLVDNQLLDILGNRMNIAEDWST